jgi:2-polyprenyl-3-methyl-5-hydroxy-6-metoxy-1,4-benzoquinol methylase
MQIDTSAQGDFSFHSSSGGDWNGRLFEWQGDIYRAIGTSYLSTLETLFQNQTIHKLVEKGLLIDTASTTLQLDNYSLVIKHRRLPFVTYPGEWSISALKEAALLILELEIELAQIGFSIHDVNPWNVLFDGIKPIFVDLGAIMPLENTSIWSKANRHPYFPAYEQFCQLILYPLYLMTWGYERIARALLLDYRGVTKTEFLRLSPQLKHQLQVIHRQPAVQQLAYRWINAAKSALPKPVRSVVRRNQTYLQQRDSQIDAQALIVDTQKRLSFMKQLKDEVESINTTILTSEWADYYAAFHANEIPTFDSTDNWTAKNHNVFKVLMDLQPSSVLDIGSNTGWYSQMAARKGKTVISFDTDEICVNQLYYGAKQNQLNIMPLVMDFRSPSPGYGPCNRWLLPATERLPCDLVIALAVVHHLVSKQYLNFEQISQTLNSFAKKWVLVEFMPPEDEWVRDWLTPEFSWYTLENFVSSMRRFFPNVEILDSYPLPRKLLLFTK